MTNTLKVKYTFSSLAETLLMECDKFKIKVVEDLKSFEYTPTTDNKYTGVVGKPEGCDMWKCYIWGVDKDDHVKGLGVSANEAVRDAVSFYLSLEN